MEEEIKPPPSKPFHAVTYFTPDSSVSHISILLALPFKMLSKNSTWTQNFGRIASSEPIIESFRQTFPKIRVFPRTPPEDDGEVDKFSFSLKNDFDFGDQFWPRMEQICPKLSFISALDILRKSSVKNTGSVASHLLCFMSIDKTKSAHVADVVRSFDPNYQFISNEARNTTPLVLKGIPVSRVHETMQLISKASNSKWHIVKQFPTKTSVLNLLVRCPSGLSDTFLNLGAFPDAFGSLIRVEKVKIGRAHV